MDDCVANFETKGLVLDFMCLLNRMYPSLALTMEEENDYRLPSLGVMVIRSGTFFLTTILYYRNLTFTGVYRQWQSFSDAENSIDFFLS